MYLLSDPGCQFLCCKYEHVLVAWKKERNNVKVDASFFENAADTNSFSIHQEGIIIVIIPTEASCDAELQN